MDGEDLVLPFDKDVVKDSPQIADSSHLDADEEQSLYAYYEHYLGVEGGWDSGNQVSSTSDLSGRRIGSGAGYDASRANTDDAMTRSEEQLRVDTKKVEAGRARLRKYVVTEEQSVQVPVSREEVRVDREPITDANRGDAVAGAEITEEEHEVVLHEERPVVTTEAVPVERVRLGTENVTDQQTISGDVRKERVEIDDDTVPRGGRSAPKNR
jgi:uncharacterized protein (TIGR02271 family)